MYRPLPDEVRLAIAVTDKYLVLPSGIVWEWKEDEWVRRGGHIQSELMSKLCEVLTHVGIPDRIGELLFIAAIKGQTSDGTYRGFSAN